jgi:hypothetical protein
MAKVGIIGEGIMMGDLKGKVSDETRKTFNEGVEFGKAQAQKEIDETWDMHFNLLYFVRDMNYFLQMVVDGVNVERLDEHFFEGAKEVYEDIIEFADDITEDLDDEDDEDFEPESDEEE